MKRNYTLVWWKSAERELMDAFVEADNRRRFSEDVDRVEEGLEQHPQKVGEDFHEGIRRVFVAGCVLYFIVSEPDRMVEVVRLRRSI
jgi:hypothetical protein